MGALAPERQPGGLPPCRATPASGWPSATLALLCTVCAFAIQNYALRRSDPSRVAC